MRDETTKTRGRRARDKLILRDGTPSAALAGHRRLKNHVLLVDDDLRETAQALGGIESFLVRALQALDKKDIEVDEVSELASDRGVLREMEYLEDTLSSLKRRLQIIASALDA